MFRKILIATDLSPASDAIIKWVQGLKWLGAGQVILCYAPGNFLTGGPGKSGWGFIKEVFLGSLSGKLAREANTCCG